MIFVSIAYTSTFKVSIRRSRRRVCGGPRLCAFEEA